MSLSIQTNVASLQAQNYIRINSNFQTNTIEQLSSGYRINSSADDAAGLAVANTLQANVAELTQGVRNANDGISQLQIIDGGLNNISQILNRLRTLATESASSTFTGDRSTLDTEYQADLAEINRQAANINLNTGGKFNSVLNVYTGGGNNISNANVGVDLSGANNGVDTTALGIANTSIGGGGTEISGNTIRLDDTAATFLTSATQTFTFFVNSGSGSQTVTANVTGTAQGLTGAQVISSLNSQLQSSGITASIASDGHLQFGGSAAFTVSTTSPGAGAVSATGTAVNAANYNLQSTAFAAFTDGGGTSASETVVFQNASGTKTVTLDSSNASTLAQALQTLNGALSGTGIYAVENANGTDVSFQSTNSFSVNETAFTAGASGGTGTLFGATGPVTVTGPATVASSTGNALAAVTALQNAVQNLGLVQGRVGAGENKLNYAVNLAQSQITNYSAAESGIRDADVASEAADLTKAQVLQQASIAALAQANAAPQAVLSLLKG